MSKTLLEELLGIQQEAPVVEEAANTDDGVAIAGGRLDGTAADDETGTVYDVDGEKVGEDEDPFDAFRIENDDEEDEELEEAVLTVSEEAALTAFVEATMELEAGLLSEQQTIVRLNRQAKVASYTTRTALILAKRANDTLYAKYAKFNKMRLDLRDLIVKKYGTKASAIARRLAAQAPGKQAPKA